MPGTGESADERLTRASPLAGTAGQAYLERRGIPVDVADLAGVRFDPDFDGRPAVLVPMRDANDAVVRVHGRYLQVVGRQDKMLTVGQGGGVVNVRGGWRVDPLIVVEGLFDALSLAVCGWASVATIGRWAPWWPDVAADRVVWLAFDGNRPGDEEAGRFAARLPRTRRLRPPDRCKDWSTALEKRGPAAVSRWVRERT